jgi:hypothetical protein
MKIKSILFSIVTFTILFWSCNNNDDDANSTQETGTLTGRVMVKNGLKPVGGALVFVFDDENNLYQTYSNANGDFSLAAPIGDRTLQIQTGGGTNFRTSIPVTVIKDQTVAVNASQTRLDQIARMAYVAGSYDEIQDIVTSLGYTIDLITNTDLANYNVVSQYDIIFLNCGAKQALANQSTIDTNLANFVTNGGSLYASDWAVAYLTGGATNSHVCSETGGFIPDDKLCSKNTGAATTITGAQVTNTSLATALGFSNLDITYDLGSWENIFSYDATYWDVLVLNPATNTPLMIKTNNFDDGVVSTPVGNNGNDWITICHNPSGNNPITISIPSAAWPAHQAHGDTLGDCSSTTNSGTIYYTTFHNHAGGNIGNSGLILEYVILNL